MRRIRACWRLLRVFLHILAGLWIAAVRLPRLQPAAQSAQVQVWSLALLGHIGITLQIRGQPPILGPVLLVANHISWLDIPVMHAARHCRFVSKSDIQDWPLVGTLATAGGTLYIERSSRRDAMRVVHLMRDALLAGEVLAVFPEGTTGDGLSVLPFHANLLQAALSADAPAQPVGLRFIDQASGQPSHAPSYVRDETLLGSIWRTLCAPPIVARVHFGESELAEGRDRRTWSAQLRGKVDGLRQG
ncbi:lysophospholipid acyltransferase family protein [Polaromonas glacialis]|uniref:lysophospholipid acyltransferase family protein n=1 Tax=Polaromonas glacialis TaxID=866564 RepID=UPI0004961E89|nr:lysophospholipid acyltransferase family protein [Polaromonas glacialis]